MSFTAIITADAKGFEKAIDQAQAKIDACKLFVQSAKNRVDEAKARLAAAEKNAKEVDEMMKVALTEQEAE